MSTPMEPVGFWEFAAQEPDTPCVITPDGPTTRGALLRQVNRLSHGLRSLNLQPGNSVAVLLPNGVEHIALALAVEQIGLRLVPLDPGLDRSEIAGRLADTGAAALVADPEFGDTAEHVAEATVVEHRFGTRAFGSFRALDDLVTPMPDSVPERRIAGQVVRYTAGTTGRPRAMVDALYPAPPERTLARVAVELTGRFDLSTGVGVHLVTAPLHHAMLGGFAIDVLHLGQTVVLMERFDAVESFRLIEKHRVTSTNVTPMMMHSWLRLPDDLRAGFDVSSLRQVIHGGAPCPVETKRQIMDWLGPIVYEHYSSAEGGTVVSIRPDEWLDRPGSVGRPEPGQVILLDDNGEVLPPERSGLVHLRVSPTQLFRSTTNAARHGYHTLGDVGRFDADGWLYLDGQLDELIEADEIALQPAEVEGALLQHPAVADTAVIGVAGDDRSHRVVGLVQLVSGYSPSTELAEEIRASVREWVEPHKVPASVEFVPVLGRLPSGKLGRGRLRDAYLARKGVFAAIGVAE